MLLYLARHSTNVSSSTILFANVFYPTIIALIPIGLKYTFCFTTCVANGSSPEDYIQHFLMLEALVETIEDTHHTGNSTFCTLGYATTVCSRLSSQVKPDTAREIVDCVNTCIEKCVMKN
ncbi:hypothetical protein PVK06_000306 [Gossypium arboreum]|uniref:Uncharacterized protein n=1 Tax=Gossypium arboreum TaxID=29729 RepID=A0ABR0QY02_GOSAR|nr:hypothetical protein PVK06_000306 [Gossypium arboreum]